MHEHVSGHIHGSSEADHGRLPRSLCASFIEAGSVSSLNPKLIDKVRPAIYLAPRFAAWDFQNLGSQSPDTCTRVLLRIWTLYSCLLDSVLSTFETGDWPIWQAPGIIPFAPQLGLQVVITTCCFVCVLGFKPRSSVLQCKYWLGHHTHPSTDYFSLMSQWASSRLACKHGLILW